MDDRLRARSYRWNGDEATGLMARFIGLAEADCEPDWPGAPERSWATIRPLHRRITALEWLSKRA